MARRSPGVVAITVLNTLQIISVMAILPDSFEISSRARARNKKGTGSPSFHEAAFLGLKSEHFFFRSRVGFFSSGGSLGFWPPLSRVFGFLEGEGEGCSGWAEDGADFLDLAAAAAAARALPMRTSATVRRPDIAARPVLQQRRKRFLDQGFENGRDGKQGGSGENLSDRSNGARSNNIKWGDEMGL